MIEIQPSAANATAVFRFVWAVTMTMPRPAWEATNSPTMAPTTAAVAVILSAESTYGSAFGSLIFTKTFHFGAPKTRPRSSSSSSICVRPTAVLITTGKKPISAAMSTLGTTPYPSQSRKSGATATFGSVLTTTRNGTSARAVVSDHAIATPSATPPRPASAKPPRISSVVIQMCACQGIEKFSAARTTAMGPGSRYSRIRRSGCTTCQIRSGAPITPGLIRRVRGRLDTVCVNFCPDSRLWMRPVEAIEAYDLFFTKERYAMQSLRQVGLRNLAYLPMYCVPAAHHPVTPTEEELQRWGAPVSFVGNCYPYRERFVRELREYPLRVWGGGWARVQDHAVRAIAGPPVFGREKLLVYSASTVSLNHHHPMNDVVGVNTRTFELAAAGACQLVDFKDDLRDLFKPGEEVVAYRDLRELRKQLDFYLARPDEARAIGENARRRALAEHTLRHRVEEMVATLDERRGRHA